ncbi:MAG TPA: hypothetical protein VK002_07405 [Rubricoccaceae bacterium]|jgi:hypothetical protein|nr:hypothetical protein [Rubricoccaceae bacterium]
MADIDYEVISASEFEKRTRGKGRGRRSRYTDLGKEAERLKENQVIAMTGSKNQVVSVRNFFKRNYGDDFQVRSVAGDGDTYEIYVQRAGK